MTTARTSATTPDNDRMTPLAQVCNVKLEGGDGRIDASDRRKMRRFMKLLARHHSHGPRLALSKRRQFDLRLRHCGPPHTP